MATPTRELKALHRRSSKHRADLERSKSCACFHCKGTFSPARIKDWTDSGTTALCPLCGIDSVLPGEPVLALSESLLEEMRVYWFER
ncbi:MAG: cytoplasmic protein [Polyangiales bacterium]